MADYADNINTSEFKYIGEVYFHNINLESRIDYSVKLILNENNFNFDLAQIDGSDFRLAERSNGSGVLKMLKAHWDKDNKYAVLWFKIPVLSSDIKSTFYAFWGNTFVSDISSVDDLGFLFCENFTSDEIGNQLDRSTWIPSWENTTYGGWDYYKAIDNDIDTYSYSLTLVSLIGDFRIEIPIPIKISSMFFKVSLFNWAIFAEPIVVSVKTNVGDSWTDVGSFNYVGVGKNVIILETTTLTNFTDPIGFINIHFEIVSGNGGVYVYEIMAFSNDSKWIGAVYNNVTQYGYMFPSNCNHYFTTMTNPLYGQNSWIMEAGVYLDETNGWNLDDRSHGFEFVGDENGFQIDIMHESRVRHNAIYPGGEIYHNIDKVYGGLEPNSYQEHYIAYCEPEDRIYQKITNRNSYDDIENKIDRKVEGDTRLLNVKLLSWECDSGARPSYISWFIIRKYDTLSLINFDGNELYIPYENVLHQTFDYKNYTDDLTSVFYQHESSFGGNSYHISNNICSSENDVWMSDENAVSSDPIYVTIYFDRAENLVSKNKIHYDSGHEEFYNASKMSDNDTDIHGRDHWRGTTISGCAVINFGNDRPIVNVFGIKMVLDDLNAGPKNYKFYGGLENFTNSFKLLYEGVFEKTVEWQSITFVNKSPYKYYKFEIIDTYGNNIKIQEWTMYRYIGIDKPKYVSQLRLHPADFAGLESNFPKQISLEGSNDTLNWETVMPWTNTYTPYISHNPSYGKWQRYSFTNIKGYWHYRLACKDSWGAIDGRIIIGEWEMCELEEESKIYRVLAGLTNNVKQIWASDNCGFEDESGLIYMANEKLNIIQHSKLVEEKEISGFYDDINVV